MTAHQRIVDAARRVGQPIYLVTGLYVGVGFVVGAYGAVRGDRLAAFLGFLFISGAICAALLFHAMARLAVRVSAIGLALDELRGSISRLERMTAAREPDGAKPLHAESDVRTVNLATLGRGDPATLAAATLDRSRFPRLVTAMDESGRTEEERIPTSRDEPTYLTASPEGGENGGLPNDKSENGKLIPEWNSACKADDLAACRRMFSTVVDTADPQVVARFAEDMAGVSERTETALRNAFVDSFRRGDFSGALKVGRRIVEQFPDQPIAEEFERIRPHLIRRLRLSSRDGEVAVPVSPR